LTQKVALSVDLVKVYGYFIKPSRIAHSTATYKEDSDEFNCLS